MPSKRESTAPRARPSKVSSAAESGKSKRHSLNKAFMRDRNSTAPRARVKERPQFNAAVIFSAAGALTGLLLDKASQASKPESRPAPKAAISASAARGPSSRDET